MRNVVKWGALGASAAAILLASAAASVAQDKLAQIKARQDFMEQQQKAVDAINAYAKGQGDKATALDKANELLALSPKIADLFVPGTSAKEFPGKTRAKPEAWENLDKFKSIPVGLHTAEEKLVEVIKTGTPQQAGDEMRTVYRENCNGCHTPFRLPEER
jgi:cytochrome c556